jgi:hypothetical protein
MFTPLDTILFPDDNCEVYEYKPNQYVYAIYKNGRSSLRRSNFKKLTLDEIKCIDTVDVYIRDPFERYVSGVQTYLTKVLSDDCDQATALTFVNQFLFLNRHFALQLHWILNLIQYASEDLQINIRHISESYTLTPERRNTSTLNKDIKQNLSSNNQLSYWLLADNILYKTLMNQTVTIRKILEVFEETYPDLYQEMFKASLRIANELP